MKFIFTLLALVFCLTVVFGDWGTMSSPGQTGAQEPPRRTPPDVLTLGMDAKLGKVTFSHTNHVTKKRNIGGTGPVECVECHHVEQPAAEVAKHPPLKTAWPADRTVTLTAAALLDPKTPAVTPCRSCHVRRDEKPNVWPTVPEIKHESSAATITLINQLAFHRNCAGCHDEIMKQNPTAKAPKTLQCLACHKKAA
ncbi:MAG: Class cytochrome family [Acidobacteriota bacterium]|jgi:cytochrome c553|nr:Class cytochrome family [Acidobacteriota bacterium]